MTVTSFGALTFAKMFAAQKHRDQWYGVLPYTHHLQDVERVLRRFDGATPEELLIAAWLHDVVEDTGTKIRDIEELFGEYVAALVEAVTERDKATYYAKIRKAGPDAVRLKLADRIANVENGGAMRAKYAREYDDFRRALYGGPLIGMFYNADHNVPVWAHLDNLMKE